MGIYSLIFAHHIPQEKKYEFAYPINNVSRYVAVIFFHTKHISVQNRISISAKLCWSRHPLENTTAKIKRAFTQKVSLNCNRKQAFYLLDKRNQN